MRKIKFISTLILTIVFSENALSTTCTEADGSWNWPEDIVELGSLCTVTEIQSTTYETIEPDDSYSSTTLPTYDVEIKNENGDVIGKRTYVEGGDGMELVSYQKLENNKVTEELFLPEGSKFFNDCQVGGYAFDLRAYRKYDENGQPTEEKRYEWNNNASIDHLTSETKYENGDEIETIYNYGEGAEGVLVSTQTYKNGHLIGDASYVISEYCPEEGDCFDMWTLVSTNNYAQDTNIKEYNPADGSYTIKDENGNIIGFEGKRIYTIDEANQVAGKTNTFSIRYR